MTMAWVHFDIELPGTVLNSREVVREHELAGHLLSAVREQSGNDTHTTYSHIFLFQVPTYMMLFPVLGVYFQLNQHSLDTYL